MSHDKNGTTGLNHMNKRQLAEGLEFLDDLTEEERKRFDSLPDEDKHRCIAQNLISHQDDKLWDDDIGISQLEGRIVTKSFQG